MYFLKATSLIATILLMGWMYYFLVGCGPLLILKHDDTRDAGVIRGFFDVHYRVLTGIAALATVCFAAAERPILAVSMAVIATYGYLAQYLIVAPMDRLRPISFEDKPSIRAFRRHHVAGFCLNIAALALLMAIISRPSAALFTCVNVPPGCQGSDCRHQCSL
jgi:hypothetical protein